ncbi:MAG: response regulator transcription factor [Bacteroides sp.]|nr:response regulator transcription factor [Bacteroides sp.]
MQVLLIEDNSRISEFIVKGLESNDMSVVLAQTGGEARRLLDEQKWDIILLDIMLPDIDGLELLQYARFRKVYTPILVISALGEPDDKVKALDCGADDHLSKPFHFTEMIARIHALTRRARMHYEQPVAEELRCADLCLNIDRHQVERGGQEISLTLQEFKLLRLLMENADKVLSRAQILESVWGINFDTNTNVIDVYISYLRNKIDAGQEHKLIHTVKGRGYLIRTGI